MIRKNYFVICNRYFNTFSKTDVCFLFVIGAILCQEKQNKQWKLYCHVNESGDVIGGVISLLRHLVTWMMTI